MAQDESLRRFSSDEKSIVIHPDKETRGLCLVGHAGAPLVDFMLVTQLGRSKERSIGRPGTTAAEGKQISQPL